MSKSKGSEPDGNDPLREHDLAKKLLKDGKPVDYICVKGYVGKSDSNDIIRIYLNLQFNEYVEINKSDILHAEEIDDIEHGGTCIWVRKDAEITRVRVETTKQQAKFMQGEIAQAQLRPTPMAEAVRGLRPVPFSVNIVECKSLGIACTAVLPCPTTNIVECKSLGIACTAVLPCPTTNIVECKSLGIACTAVLPCPTTNIVECKSLGIACTAVLPCPTTNIVECKSLGIACTAVLPCPTTNIVECKSPGIACIPSILLACPTVPPENTCGIICPTLIKIECPPSRWGICDPSAIDACPTLRGCPSIVNNCASIVNRCPVDPMPDDPITQLKSEINKLRAKVKKLEEESG